MTGTFLSCIALGATPFSLAYGIQELVGALDIKTLWNMGFGAVSETALATGLDVCISPDHDTLLHVYFTNVPQSLFSILYFQYNGFFTCMLSSREWSSFSKKKKPLRVSSHLQGQQRSRYFLQLPYRFSIPLIIISILMHWVLSQSLFLVVGDKREDETSDLEWQFATVEYSPIAIMFAVITSLFMVAWVVITG